MQNLRPRLTSRAAMVPPRVMEGYGVSKEQLKYETVLVGAPPPLRIEYTDVPTDLIDFDPENPRLRYRSSFDNTTAGEMLLSEQSTKFLKVDIKANGLFERPYVMRHGERFIAKEGNRRLSVYQDLLKEDPTNPQWQTMPVRILPDSTTPQQMAIMLAQWHVTGKDPWSAHERAGHIYQMSEVLHLPDEVIKATLHMGMPTINKAVAAYRMMMERYVVIDGGVFREHAEGKFTFFDEFYRAKGLRDRMKTDPFIQDDFCRWVGEGRVPTSENVRLLPAILANPMAERLFRESEKDQAFRRAADTLEANDPTRKSKFFTKIKELLEAGAKATVADFRTAATPNGRQLLHDARAMIETISRHADNTVQRAA